MTKQWHLAGCLFPAVAQAFHRRCFRRPYAAWPARRPCQGDDGGRVLGAGATFALLSGRRAATGGSGSRGAGRTRQCPWARAVCGRTATACRSWWFSGRWAILPTACTASVWNMMPPAAASSPFPPPGKSCRFRYWPIAGDNRHAVIQQRFVFVHVQPAALVHFQLVDDIALLFQPVAQGEDGRVLDHGGGDDGVAVGLGFQRRRDGGGVGFRCRRRKMISDSCSAPSRPAPGCWRFSAPCPPGCQRRASTSVAKVFGEKRQHGFHHGRVNPGGGVIVQIDRFHGRLQTSGRGRARAARLTDNQ